MRPQPRYVVRGLVFAFVVLLLTGSRIGAQGPGSDTNGAILEAPVRPVVAQLTTARGDDVRVSRQVLHPRGQAELEAEKEEAELSAPVHIVAAAPAPLAPTIETGFDGISFQDSFCNCIPPDGAIAAGPNHLLGTVNTAFKVWNKSGTLLRGPISLPSFFSVNPASLPNVSDPFTLYDGAANRFVLGALTYDSLSNSSITIAVTQTDDPTGTWLIYSFPVSPAANLLDFPHAAVGSDAIYLAGNQFLGGSLFLGARVYAYNKSQMYAGAAASSVHFDVGNSASGVQADSLYPAQAVGVSSSAYFIATDNCNSCSIVSLWKFTNPFVTPSFTLQGGVSVNPYSQPPDAAQPGGGALATNDTRALGAYWYSNTVYATHTIGVSPGGGGTVAGIQWFQVSNLDSMSPSLVQQGTIAAAGQYRFYPNLAVDSLGDMAIAYAYSSSADFAGIHYTGRLAGDSAGTVQTESVLKTGEATVTNNSRYGDYSGTVLDPDGSTFWQLEEYARSGSVWGTWVGSFGFSGGGPDFSMGASPSSQTVVSPGSTTYTVTLTSLNGYNQAVNLTLSGLGLPPTAGSFNPSSVVPSQTGTLSALTVNTNGMSAGTYSLTITGTGASPSLTHSTTVTLVVNSTSSQDFSISATPSSRAVAQGNPTSYAVTVTPSGNFSGTVSLRVDGLPTGATATFSPGSITGGSGSSTMNVATSTSTPTGSYTLTITGTSGSFAHSTTVALAVNGFSISASPPSRTVTRGTSATYSATVTAINGFNGTVRLSVRGLPFNSSASFNPGSLTGQGTSTLTVSTNTSTSTGTFTLRVRGTSGSVTHSTTVQLVVQ